MEVRDLWPQTLIDIGALGERHPVTRVLSVLERYLYRRAVRIVTPLPMAHEYITGLGIPRERIVWIPNGVDLERYPPPDGEDSLGHEGFCVMYLGSHGPANDLRVLLRAALEIQRRGAEDVRVVLVGDGPEKRDLMREAEARGIRNVEFRDPVRKTEIPAVLRQADATTFVLADLPLYRFGVSLNKTFDYLAAGKPLIVAGRPRNDIVAEAGCGLRVPPGDPAALARAILELRALPAVERRAMGMRGRRHLEETYDIRILGRRLEECLQACMIKAERPGRVGAADRRSAG
jgi:glycosyltransferase involved in cell wall biosynthesis